MQKIERKHLTLRTRLKRLARKTLYCPREGIADLETHRKSSAKVQA